MVGRESAAALLAATTGRSVTGSFGPTVAGANAGPDVMVVLLPAWVGVVLGAGATLRLSAGAAACDAVTRAAGILSAGATGAGFCRALSINAGLGAASGSAAAGPADARMTTKVQPTITDATMATCSGLRPPARARAGEACATGSSAGVTSG